jgi:hypothetical protein
MAITNPQAVTFCNEKIRPVADRYAQLYWFAKMVLTEWNSTGMSAIIPNQGGETVVDGSETDGRTPISGAHVNGMITNLQLLVNDLEANSNAKLNGLSQIAVNEQP